MMLTVPGLLSPEDVAECRAALEGAAWVDGRVTAGHQAVGVKTNRQLALDDPVTRRLGDLLLRRLEQCPLYIASVLPLRVLPPRFNRYEGEGAYGSHIDNALQQNHLTGLYVRTDVSCTVFFSDPDEYEGGDLVVEDSYGEHRVKLPAGDMVIYPGTSHHRVTPVTQGVRFASFFWTQSLVGSEIARRTLFELDSAIQRLTADHPGHASIAALTGVYHNLLRQWSAP
ncbi:Fe2+-dependent dioxygenase [Novosphingobium album (ex Liu et al. 2023)]|uniref:Fe2+-dependent dioxygenase n=1 Tax=Novosphingobium album (ex Liu et al. 2023) TaxID=3031130 RepID=A0ABT5WN88_9SPHN|nr:Fe2+-dependent dioxygenase [Novosphingobium album (ex Liu et al. 2023)]MDE8651500.1 Fe2+-dependent dioxygenase [Novosphingobium album (ex Liu et al. 2023)]